MSQVVDFAEELASDLRDAGVKATAEITGVELPGVLVDPLPQRDYDRLSECITATWSVVLIAAGPGTLDDVRNLEEILEAVLTVVDPLSFEAASYVLPGLDPRPAYVLKFETTITPEEGP